MLLLGERSAGSTILPRSSPLQQFHVPLAAAKTCRIHPVAVEQLKVEVAERSGPVQDRVSLVTIPATRHDGGEIVMGMVGGIAEVTPDHHRGLVEQRAPLSLRLPRADNEAQQAGAADTLKVY